MATIENEEVIIYKKEDYVKNAINHSFFPLPSMVIRR